MRSAITLLTAVTIVGTACAPDTAPDAAPFPASVETTTSTSKPMAPAVGDRVAGGGGGPFVRSLTPFSDCSTLLDHLRSEARERVTPWGLGDQGGYWFEEDVVFAEEMSGEMAFDEMADTAEAAAEPAASAPATAGDTDAVDDSDFSRTNTQEAGVDEPDIIKTDGRKIVTISEGLLTVVDADDEPMVTGRLRLPDGWGHELFFADDRAIVVTNGGSWGYPMPVDVSSGDAEAEFADRETELVEPFVPHDGPAAVIYEIDLVGDPTVVATMRVEGQYLSARSVGHSVRLALSGGIRQFPWLYPSGPGSEDRALDANRSIVEDTTLDDWIPSYELRADGVDEQAPLLDCADVNRPAEFAGFDMVTVLDLSLDGGLVDGVDDLRSVGVLAAGQTVYSSTDRFYVATNTWIEPGLSDTDIAVWREAYRTDLHAFAIAPDEPTRYVASGSIEGSLLNQFSISEHDGFVRVLTTEGSPWDQSDLSETSLSVLAERDGELVEVGRVGGLGKGERLYSARLLGEVGFAVTFREVDPFYVLDLREPTNPRVVGELKIPGFSTYLHPVGDDRVLGLGQSATEDGRTTGLKLSLFDVSDASDPREISVWTLPNSTSPAEYDHRAFQLWGDRAIVPVQSWADDFNGAIVFEIGDRITELGRISHSERTEAESDCRTMTSDDFPEESEFFWMTQDGQATVLLCGADDIGDGGSGRCEVMPVDEARYWFWDESLADDALEALDVRPTDRFEICFREGSWEPPIQRSLVIGNHVWTMATDVLQVNDLDTFEVRGRVTLR